MSAVALLACSPEAPARNPLPEGTPQIGLQHVQLTIHSGGRDHRFDVEVAATLEQQDMGLMFRRSLGDTQGMLFPYAPPQEVAFWMKNTLIPLDIIYIRDNGTIARITQAKPLDLTPLPSGEPVSAVLEIRAGRAAELGVREGDMVSWRPLPAAR